MQPASSSVGGQRMDAHLFVELQQSRAECATLQLDKTRLINALFQVQRVASSTRSGFDDQALLACLSEALADGLAAQSEGLEEGLRIGRLSQLCQSQRRVIGQLLQKQQGVLSTTAIKQIWTIVKLITLQLKKASQTAATPLEAVVLAKEIKQLRQLLELLVKPAVETAHASSATDADFAGRDSATSPRVAVTCSDAQTSCAPTFSLAKAQTPHATLGPSTRRDVATDQPPPRRSSAETQTSAARTSDRRTQTDRLAACETCAARTARKFVVENSAVHAVNFGTSEELLECRRAVFAGKQSLKHCQDERNKLALEVEDKKHKLAVVSRRAKLVHEELKADAAKHRAKHADLVDQIDKLNQTVTQLKFRAREPPPKPQATSISRDWAFSSLPPPGDGGDRRTPPVSSPSCRGQAGSERRLVLAASAEKWQRIVSRLSEPELATIRQSVQLVGLEGVTRVLSGLIQ